MKRVPRPSNAPRRIPRWAWQRDRWLVRKPGERGERPGPAKLPSWFWPWRVWKASPHKAPAPPSAPKPTRQIAMFDSVTVSQIPRDAEAVAGYVNGYWPTYATLLREFPHARKLSIAVTVHADAECLDVEPGDAVPEDAPYWVKRQIRRGIRRPVVYTSVSQAARLMSVLAAHGIKRSQYRLWTAHYTFQKHFCGPACGFSFAGRADATQWTDRANNLSLDESICAPDFFS